MQSKMKQKGLTGISIMVIVLFILFSAVIFLKIMPIYFDAFKVGDVVSGLKEEQGIINQSRREITSKILKRLDVNMVTDITKDDIFIEKVKNVLYVDVEYEVRKNMFGNLDIVVYFKESVQVSGF